VIESGRRHGAFDVRYPTRRKTAASVCELPRDWDRRARLEWSVFVAGSFPNRLRHDFEALAAYEAYGNALDRASPRRSTTRRPARHTQIDRGGGSRPPARRAAGAAGAGLVVQTVSPSPALSVWESEGGSVGRGDFA